MYDRRINPKMKIEKLIKFIQLEKLLVELIKTNGIVAIIIAIKFTLKTSLILLSANIND